VAAKARTVGEAVGGDLSFEVDWDAAPSEGEPLRGLADLIKEGTEALLAVAGESLGRAALKDKVKRVRFADGAQAAVSLKGDELLVTARLAFGAEGRLDGPALVAAIERVL